MKSLITILISLIIFCSQAQELHKSFETAHNGKATGVAITTDGSHVISVGTDKRAYLWNVKEGKVKSFGHATPVTAIAFNANDEYFVTSSTDMKIILWNYKTGKPVKILKEQAEVTSLAFNPINDYVGNATKGKVGRIWDAKAGSLISSLKGHSKTVNKIVFSSDGKWVATGSSDNTIKIWGGSNGQEMATIETGQKEILSMAFSADGSYLAAGDKNGNVVLWDPVSNERKYEYSIEGAVNTLAFSADVQYLFAAGTKNKITIWNMETKQVQTELKAHEDGITGLAVADKGNYMASVANDGSLKIWDIKGLKIGNKKFVKTADPPMLVMTPLRLNEDNENGIIEAGEKPTITFTVENTGKGKAFDVVARTSIDSKIDGIKPSKEVLIGNIDVDKKRIVTIPIAVSKDIETASGTFIVTLSEGNGNNPTPLKVGFQSRGSQQYSYIMVMGHSFSSATGKAEIGAPITLKVKIKNTSEGTANNIKVNFHMPDKVLAVDKISEKIPTLGAGEEKEISMQFYADKDFKQDKIKLALTIDGAAFTNANDLIMAITMNENLPGGEVYSAEVIAAAMPTEKPLYRGGGDPLKGLNVSKAKDMQIGDYYALIIAIDQYKGHWTPLQNAVNDAKAVEALLRSKYKFDHFRSLYNASATRTNIIKEMEWLVANVKEVDNLFIYYSGHGEFKKELNKGYWVPVDATTSSTSNYISNSDIQTFLGGIRSKHTLLVSDACFSGDIFRGNTVSVPFDASEKYYKEVHNLISRQALTSGGLEPVMDGGREGHSVFAYYFLKTLRANENKYFDAGQLYTKIKIPVINNSEQTPKIAPVKNSGDEGGQFIFIRK